MERHANLIGVYDAEETIEAKLGSVAAENEKNKSNERPSTCAPPPFFFPWQPGSWTRDRRISQPRVRALYSRDDPENLGGKPPG